MKKEEVLKSVGKLVHDIDHWTGELVAARGKRDEDRISYAHWAMESLMVAAHQELTFLAEYIEEHLHDDEEIDAAFKYADEVQYQNGYEKRYNDALANMPHWRSLTEQSCDEEDEEHVNSLLKRLEGLCRKEFATTRFAISEDEDWLKSLKDRVFPQPKQEWTKEDKDNLEYVLELAEEGMSLDEVCICWLESLKDRVVPQPMWKPTGEQMEFLKIAIERINNDAVIEGLISLYNDLKKL